MERITCALADGVTIARRNVIKIIRVPEILVAVLIMPLVFMVLFAYVFGSAIEVPGGSYREFLVGGTFAMILTFGATFTGAGLADDMQKGIIDPFPVVAHVTVGGGVRPDGQRCDVQRSVVGHHGPRRAGHRLADPQWDRKRAARIRAATAVRLCHLMGNGLRRLARSQS